MKSLLAPACFLLLSTLRGPGDFLIHPDDSVVIAGDSITNMGGYSAFMEDYLLMCQPTQGVQVAQLGWDGEQATGFLARIDSTLLPFKPTVVTTCYGMNDGGYTDYFKPRADVYRKAETDIVEALKKDGVRVIVIGSPKCVDTFTYGNHNPAAAAIYNKTLSAYADIDKAVAAQEGVIYADVFDATTAAMVKAKAQYGESYVFAGEDGVHPFGNGHLAMAYAFLKALGCDGNIGTITVDAGLNHAEGSPGHEIVSCQNGILTVKSTRYPYCFGGTPNKPEPTPAAVVNDIPFNEDLNRYMLVVRGLTTSKTRITWGTASKEFASADLAKGINLAAEFLANPFVDQFGKVDGAVHVQEQQERILTQSFLYNEKQYRDMAPTASDAIDQVSAAALAQRNVLLQKAAALVIPIQHTIKIEPEPDR